MKLTIGWKLQSLDLHLQSSRLYYTEIGLGTPANTYYVQVDTRSDLLWVNCRPCPACPSNSDLNISLCRYNPSLSSTSSNISCSSTICTKASKFTESYCVDNSCYHDLAMGMAAQPMGTWLTIGLPSTLVLPPQTALNMFKHLQRLLLDVISTKQETL